MPLLPGPIAPCSGHKPKSNIPGFGQEDGRDLRARAGSDCGRQHAKTDEHDVRAWGPPFIAGGAQQHSLPRADAAVTIISHDSIAVFYN